MSEQRLDKTLLAMFSLGHLANDWGVGAIWLVAPAMAIAMGLGAEEVGLLITLYGFGAALAYLPAGLLADRLARRGGLLVATFWWVAIGHVLASLAPDYWSFALLMALAVMGDAAWHPIATGYLVQRYPRRRAQVLGIHAMGGTVGAEVLAPLGVGAVLAFADWRTALQVAALPAAVMGCVFLFVARRMTPVAVSETRLDLRGLIAPWTNAKGLHLALAMVLYNMAIIAVIAMMPLYLQTDLSYAPMVVAVVFAVSLLAGSLIQPFVGRWSDQFGRKVLLVSGLLLGGAALLTAGIVSPGLVAVGCLMVGIAVLTGIRSMFLAAAVDLASHRASSTLALAFTILDGVGAIGALVAGHIGAESLSRAFVLAAVLSVVATVAALRFERLARVSGPVTVPTAPVSAS